MGRAFAALLLTTLLAAPATAQAAACCVGSTSDQASRLGPCERVLLGVGYSLELPAAEWDAVGDLHRPAAPRVVHRFSGVTALRVDDRFQFGFAMPLVLQAVSVGDRVEAGGGPGDLRAWLRVEPRPGVIGPGPPVAGLGFALVLPTGIPPEQAPGGLGAGGTGAGYLGLAPSFDIEKQGARGLIRLSVDGTFSVPRPWEDRVNAPGVALGADVSGAFFVDWRTTIAISGGARVRTPGWFDGKVTGRGGVEPWLGVGASFGVRGFDRLSVGLRTSLPVPRIGRSMPVSVLASVTWAHVRR